MHSSLVEGFPIFTPESFEEFHDTFLGPHADGFDLVNHVKYLALRRLYAMQ